ncbi:MAG: GntR family transcriptional regulator [Methylocystaceae bacterium]|nr:GntR family transcriptional regulator [Methylocystaceae bacterium]
MAAKRSEELLKELEHDILTGTLTPGMKLDEKSLTERFNVSRTPVREALHKLASIGLIDILPRRGATVRKVGLKELIEMFEVMAELEGLCGLLATQRMTNDEVQNLRHRHEDTYILVENGQYDTYYDANVLFHECIYKGSHNNFLAEQTMNLRNRVAPYRRIQLRTPRRLETSFAEHEKILHAIEARDAEQTSELLKSHVTVQQGSFNNFISTLPMDLLRDGS